MGRYAFIKDEMLVHVPVCTHASPERILIVGGSETLVSETDKYSFSREVERVDGAEGLFGLPGQSYDVVILAQDGVLSDKSVVDAAISLLDEKGILSAPMSHLVSAKDAAIGEMETLSESFAIVMPYRYERDDICDGALVSSYMVLASRFYHPVADINLQRADLTDGYRYFGSDVAIASFQLPAFIVDDYLGIVKR